MDKITFILSDIKVWTISILYISFEGIINVVYDNTTHYLFNDFTYLRWLVITMILDFVTGLTKAWVNRVPITSKGFRNSVSKVIQYGSFLIITHVLTHFQILGQDNSKFQFLNNIAYTFLILTEIKSVYENAEAINPKLAILKPLIKFIDRILKISKEDIDKS